MRLFYTMVLCMLCFSRSPAAEEFTRERYGHIDSIRIGEMSFEGRSLDSILFYLIGKIESLDTSPGEFKRMSFIDAGFTADQRLPLADYNRKKVKVKEALGDLSRIYEVSFYATSIGIVVTPRGAKPFPNYKAKEGEVFYMYPATKSEQGEEPGVSRPAN